MEGKVMKFCLLFFISCNLVVGFSAISANADEQVLSLAHKYGFNGCDNAINAEIASYDKSATGRISLEHFEQSNKSISILFTFGTPGDSVFVSDVFTKDANICYVYKYSQINSVDSCIAYKENNPAWKFVDTQGDYTWTKNIGGVDALMLSLPKGGCVVNFKSSNKYPADK